MSKKEIGRYFKIVNKRKKIDVSGMIKHEGKLSKNGFEFEAILYCIPKAVDWDEPTYLQIDKTFNKLEEARDEQTNG